MCVEIETPCRECETCLRKRARLWTARIIAETRAAPRTWFATLTLSPDQQHLALTHARWQAAKKGVDFDALSAMERFRLHDRAIQPELTKWLKRVRESGGPFRYCMVLEAHKSNMPHYHAVLHEVTPLHPLRHAMLTDRWRLGFSTFKLVDEPEKAGGYVAKYLAKSNLARVRASIDYGNPPQGSGPQRDREKDLDHGN